MARGGFERPPLWAVVVMVVGGFALIAGLLLGGGAPKDPLTQAQAAREAAAAAPSHPGPTLASLRADGSLGIYFIGDSITDGWNASTQDRGYRAQVVDGLRAGGPVAASGDYKAGATLDEAVGLAHPPKSVDVAVIELGTNDVDHRTDPAVFAANYERLAATLDKASSVLICVGVYRNYGDAPQLDSSIRAACGRHSGVFVAVEDLRGTSSLVAPLGSAGYPAGHVDGTHPNDGGHAEIARRVLAAIGVG